MKHPFWYAVLGLALTALVWTAIFAWNSVIVIGGQYTLGPGRTLDRDLIAVFARVVVEDGARVDGRITGISSDLDLQGAIGGDILAIESEVTVRPSCKASGAQREFDAFKYVFLFPELLRLGIEAIG